MSTSSYPEHIQQLQQRYTSALSQPETESLEAVLIHSGMEHSYFGDDRGVPFQAFGHFCHWLPINRPDQFLLIQPGRKPCYLQVIPHDFWHDQRIDNQAWWATQFDIIQLGSVSELATRLPANGLAYLGESPRLGEELGAQTDTAAVTALQHYLDYQRAYKTSYEIDQLKAAADLALQGHEAARQAFLQGGSEYAIHMAYLSACNIQELDTPYTNIVAVNDNAAILHYQHKQSEAAKTPAVLLIDAGCRVHNYGSDITRTTATDNAHPVFRELLTGMEALELALVDQVAPGERYVTIHDAALRGIASLLCELDICRATPEAVLEQQLAQLFMPHGVGHLLGVQVHDVAGHQQDTRGTILAPPAHSPALRNTRIMAEQMVFTIEPGCYFIPMLLEPERQSPRGKLVNWDLVQDLYACGGIRVEDNVVVTADGCTNLSR